MKKIILLDKSVLRGTPTHKLKQFVNNYFLILPRVLYDECVTDEKDPKEILLKRFGDVISAGGYTCRDGMYIVQREGQMLQPFPFLADYSETNEFRETVKRLGKLPKPDRVEDIHEKHMNTAQILLDIHEKMVKVIAPKILEEPEEKRGFLEANKLERFKHWVRASELLDIHKIAIGTFSHLMDSPEKFCLSRDWVTWDFLLLALVLTLDYAFLQKGKGGEKELINAEHDLQDLEYVFLLGKADAFMTIDDGCICLAKAAFPEKDVFSSLDEVPDEYICHWSKY